MMASSDVDFPFFLAWLSLEGLRYTFLSSFNPSKMIAETLIRKVLEMEISVFALP